VEINLFVYMETNYCIGEYTNNPNLYLSKRGSMELSWQDIRNIVRVADSTLNSIDYEQIQKLGEQGYYQLILDRLNKGL
jgi:hypothetical protein